MSTEVEMAFAGDRRQMLAGGLAMLALLSVSAARGRVTAAPTPSALPTDPEARVRALFDASVPYMAQRFVTIGDRRYGGRVLHRPGLSREEMVIDGAAQLLLIDWQAKEALIAPAGTPLMVKVSAANAAGLLAAGPGDILAIDAIGRDTVAGRPATVHALRHREGEGRLWHGDDGILLRADGRTKDGKAVGLELAGLTLSAPPEAIMRPPADRQLLVLDIGRMDGASLRAMLALMGVKVSAPR